MIYHYLKETSDNAAAELPFKLHDFGSRGVSSQESAMIGGAAHLVNFMGSDTIAGIYMANKFYNHEMAAFSVPASEHSTMTMWGKARETEAYANMLEQYKDQPIFACVSDSYDIFNATKNIWGGALKDKVIAYEGTLVVRPDSGDPAQVVTKLLELLKESFGATRNSKGYWVLDHNVRVLQGDGVNYDSIKKVLDSVRGAGFSATNIGFGMGGALLQQLDRDTQKFAFKCSWAEVDGKDVDVYKSPVTDVGKASKRGRLELIQKPDGEFTTTRRGVSAGKLAMVDVYRNGELLVEHTLEEVRSRAAKHHRVYSGWGDRPIV